MFGDVEVVVRHTFLAVPDPVQEALRSQRSSSTPPPSGCCDRSEHLLHSLTYKTPPVLGRGGKASVAAGAGRCGWVEEEGAPSETTTAPDADTASEATSVSDATPTAVPSAAGAGTPSSSSMPISPVNGAISVIGGRAAQPRQQLPVMFEAPGDIPRDEWGAYTSVGSVGHAQGTCKPCVFAHHAEKSCANGVSCRFCHFEHAPKRRMRLRKQRRPELRRPPVPHGVGGDSWWAGRP